MSVDVGGLVAAVGSVAAGYGATTVALRSPGFLWRSFVKRCHLRDVESHEPTLEERLKTLTVQMNSSAKLVALVTAEMDLRRQEVERLQQEQQQAEVTRTLTRDQLAAIRDQLVAAVRPETNRGIRWSILIGILGFVAGVLAAVAVALFVHPLS